MTDQTMALALSSKLPRRFPLKLHYMIEEAYQNGQEDLICWLSCGTQFRIGNPKEFAETLMSKYCRHKNYKSFLRQLSMYKFQRSLTVGGPNKNAYYHPHFLRDRLDLTVFIDRDGIRDIPTSPIYPAKNKMEMDAQKYVAAAADMKASLEEFDRREEERQPILAGTNTIPPPMKLDNINFGFSDVTMESHLLPATAYSVAASSPLVVSQPIAMPRLKDIVDEIIFTFRGDYTQPSKVQTVLSLT